MSDNIGAVPVLSMSLIRESIMRARLAANADRKNDAVKRMDYYNGEQLVHLQRLLNAQFAFPAKLKLQPHFSNITKRIINEISVVYKKSPIRTLTLEGKNVEGKGAEAFAKMYQGARADAVLKKVNRYTNLLNTIGLLAVWRNGRVELDILTPDIANIVQDEEDPTRAKAVIIEQSFADTVTVGANKLYIAWTADEHMVFSDDGMNRPDLANEKGTNPYKHEGAGVIPIAWFRDAYPDGYFWNSGTDDLISAQDNLNVFLTELNQLVKMQSFSVPVVIGDAPTEGLVVDPSMFIVIPLGDATAGKGQPDFKFVSPSPKIAEMIEAIKECVRRVADDYGLSMDSFKLSGSPASGLSLMLSNIRLIERREDDMVLYRDYEADLFKIMRAVWNYNCSPADRINEKADFSVNFSEMDFPQDPAAEDARWITLIGQNVKSRAEWMRHVDPDLKTDEEAIARLKANAAINKDTRSMLPSGDPDEMLKSLMGGSGPKTSEDAPGGEDAKDPAEEAPAPFKGKGGPAPLKDGPPK